MRVAHVGAGGTPTVLPSTVLPHHHIYHLTTHVTDATHQRVGSPDRRLVGAVDGVGARVGTAGRHGPVALCLERAVPDAVPLQGDDALRVGRSRGIERYLQRQLLE